MPNGKPPSPGRAKELGLGRGKFSQSGYDGVRGSPTGFPGAGTRDKLPPGGPSPYSTTPPPKKPPY